MSTTPHPDAALLRAIADGKQMQGEGYGTKWMDIPAHDALRLLSHAKPCRIKPEFIVINGVECPKPNKKAEKNWVSIVCANGRESVHCFDSTADAIAVYEALIKPFKEC